MTKKTLEDYILNFDNNYPLGVRDNPDISVSVIIPYFESKNTINLCLKHVLKSVENYKGKSEVIIVDDGSKKYPVKEYIPDTLLEKIRLIKVPRNKGRYYSRNFGLLKAKNDLVFFIDSDVLIYPELVSKHTFLHAKAREANKSCVTFCLFNFVEGTKENNFDFNTTNDFRDYCVYQKSWKGSDKDEKYAGIEYKILEQTKRLRHWPGNGKLGPWVLPNMVLGGCFALLKDQAIKVNGCSGVFGKYGFEETSLVTKLMAKYHSYVVPVVDKYAIHIYDKSSAIEKQERDSLFQKTHAIYFNQYIKQSLNEAIEKDKKYFKEE